jgi:hypothetical protein
MTHKQFIINIILVTLLCVLALGYVIDYHETKQTVQSHGVQLEALKTAQYPMVVVSGDYAGIITNQEEIFIDEKTREIERISRKVKK